MTGTFWLNIDGTAPILHDLLQHVVVDDREELFQSVFGEDSCPSTTSLSMFQLSDFNLPHGSLTPEIYKAAARQNAKIPTPKAALQILLQHPNIFRSTIIDGKPIEGCLVGIKPIVAPSGKKYVIELSEVDNCPLFRFRRADDDVRWPNYEFWVFET